MNSCTLLLPLPQQAVLCSAGRLAWWCCCSMVWVVNNARCCATRSTSWYWLNATPLSIPSSTASGTEIWGGPSRISCAVCANWTKTTQASLEFTLTPWSKRYCQRAMELMTEITNKTTTHEIRKLIVVRNVSLVVMNFKRPKSSPKSSVFLSLNRKWHHSHSIILGSNRKLLSMTKL